MAIQSERIDIPDAGEINWPDRNKKIYVDPGTGYLILSASGLNNLYVGAAQETRINKIQVGQYIEGYYTDLHIRHSGGVPNLKVLFQLPSGVTYAVFDESGDFLLISPTYGGEYGREKFPAESVLSGLTTTLETNIPGDNLLVGYQFMVKTLITSGDGATSWRVKLTGGASDILFSGKAFTKNTPVKKRIPGIELTAETDFVIEAEPIGKTFSGGEIVCVPLVETVTDLDTYV